jgi:TolA-binding protein
LILALVGMAAAPAAAQLESREGIALQNQILDLRHELDQLRAQAGGGAPSGSALGGGYVPTPVPRGQPQPPVSSDITAQLLDRVSMLEDEVRRLRGRSDELANQLQQTKADLAKQISDLSFQLQSGAGRPSSPPAGNLAAPPPGPSTAQPPGPVRRTPQMALQEGNAALARRDYPAAEAAAKEVLATRTASSTDAQFLYAQALAGARNYPAAAVAYNDAYERAHSGTHAADALLGLASSLAALNDPVAACGALNKLRLEVPNPRADLAAPIASLRAKTNCR